MKAEEVVVQLEKLKFHCESMSRDGESEEWKKDVEALDFAIKIIKDKERNNA